MAAKTVLITGCSKGGIGDALAQEFHRKGCRVFATARNLDKVQHLKDFGMDVIELDVVDSASLKAAVERVAAMTGGTLDILVNNAGGGYHMPLLDADLDTAKAMFNVNVFALIGVTQAFAPLLIAAKGTVINLGSIAGCAPIPWQGFYNASKAAVNQLSDDLRLELKPLGVGVICLVTGGLQSLFFTNCAEKRCANRLPKGSYYTSGEELIEQAEKQNISRLHPLGPFAEKVVVNALREKPKPIQWLGGGSWDIWFARTFFWHTFIDRFLMKVYGVNEFARRWREGGEATRKILEPMAR